MDDGRVSVSYEKAVEAIRRLGYAGVEREEDEVTLYADDVPYCSVKNVHYPLRVWDEEHLPNSTKKFKMVHSIWMRMPQSFARHLDESI